MTAQPTVDGDGVGAVNGLPAPQAHSPTLICDREANALYIRFPMASVADTVELSQSVSVDLDEAGDPDGFDALHAEADILASLPALPNMAAFRDLVKPVAS